MEDHAGDPGVKRAPTQRSLLLWAAVAVLAAGASIVLHELGHYFAARAFGFPDVTLHYGSVSHRAADAGFPAWQQGLQAAAGPLVTLAIVLACCCAAFFVGPSPWAIAPAFAAGIRSLIIGPAYLVTRIFHPAAEGNFDELNAARHLGLSPDLVIAVNVLLLAGAWVYLAHRIPRGRRIATLATIFGGTVAGLIVYIAVVGPWLLP